MNFALDKKLIIRQYLLFLTLINLFITSQVQAQFKSAALLEKQRQNYQANL